MRRPAAVPTGPIWLCDDASTFKMIGSVVASTSEIFHSPRMRGSYFAMAALHLQYLSAIWRAAGPSYPSSRNMGRSANSRMNLQPATGPRWIAVFGASRNAGRCTSQMPCSDEGRNPKPWAQLARVRSATAQGTKGLTPSGTQPWNLLTFASLSLRSDMTSQRPSIARISIGMPRHFFRRSGLQRLPQATFIVAGR